MSKKNKNENTDGSDPRNSFEAFADVLGTDRPTEIDPSSGFPTVAKTINGWKFEITSAQDQLATQTTITVTNVPDTTTDFKILGGSSKTGNGSVQSGNTTFDALFSCSTEAVDAGKLNAVLLDDTIRLSLQALENCNIELKGTTIVFTENSELSRDKFSKYMQVVSLLPRLLNGIGASAEVS